MNHDDLERQLRSESGPREHGYLPTPLPAELGAASRSRGVPAVLRGGLFAAAAAAAVLAVLIVSGGLDGGFGVGGDVSTPSPGDAKTQAASPSVAPGASSEPGACRPEDVVLTGEPWGGAAGSRGTSVTLALSDGADACHLANVAVGQILDASGAALAESVPGPTDLPLLTLQPGATYQVGVAWSNWCEAAPAGPITLELRLADWTDWKAVDVDAGGADPVPPCMGAGGTTLSVTGVQPSP